MEGNEQGVLFMLPQHFPIILKGRYTDIPTKGLRG